MASRHVLNKLSAKQVATAPPGIYMDGGGLQLTVDPTGARRWILRVSIDGRRVARGLGGYPEVSLANAREKAQEIRTAAREGRDVRLRGRAAPEAPQPAPERVTFAQVFDEMFAIRRQTLSNGKHVDQWVSTMRTYVFPVIGRMPVGAVTAREVLAILKPIWFAKPETAKRVLQRMEAVFRFAILNEYRDKASPCTGIVDVLGTGHQIVTHHPAMPVANVPSFIRDVRAMDRVWPMTRLALEFLILTAARSGEVRGARWEEFDLEQRLWRVPPDRMKTKKPHVVPLSEPAIELIQGAGVLSGLQGLVFPGTRGRSLSDSTMSKLMRDAGLSATPHGFRSTFKDWASEAGWRDEVSEAALGHADTNRVRAAYRRTDFLTERRKLMDAWAAVALSRED